MKQLAILILASMVLPGNFAHGQDAANEASLDTVLTSDYSLAEKDAACAQLKRIGTEQSVPILAGLLTNADLSHSARYALESMSTPVAGRALIEALDKTTGSNLVGIINSLAVRKETGAVPGLKRILGGTDSLAATAAAHALGRIGGQSAINALQTAEAASKGPVHNAVMDGLLFCANRSLEQGNRKEALSAFRRIHDHATDEAVRVAAFRGMILSSGEEGVAMAARAIVGTDAAEQGAALQVAVKLPSGVNTTKTLCSLLAKTKEPVQIALLQCLQQRDDTNAVEAVEVAMGNADPNVHLAAISALGELGDGREAELLARAAASSSGTVRDAAREALVNLRRGNVTGEIFNVFDRNPAPVQLEFIRAFGDRADAAAVPLLMKEAESRDDTIRACAFQAIALVAGQGEVAGLVQMTVKSNDDNARSEAVEALGAVCQHVEAQKGHCNAHSLADAARTGSTETRISLLPLCAEISEPETREALRFAIADQNPQVREAGMRALCDTHDSVLLLDLLKLVQIPDNKKIQTLAIRGCVRLTTQEDAAKMSAEEKLRVLKQIFDLPLDTDQKRTILGGLGAVPDKVSLIILMPALDDNSVQPEAVAAVLRVAHEISSRRAPEAGDALRKVLTLSSLTPETRKTAQDELKAVQ